MLYCKDKPKPAKKVYFLIVRDLNTLTLKHMMSRSALRVQNKSRSHEQNTKVVEHEHLERLETGEFASAVRVQLLRVDAVLRCIFKCVLGPSSSTASCALTV